MAGLRLGLMGMHLEERLSPDIFVQSGGVVDGVSLYRFNPKPGVAYAAGIDWEAIVSGAASVIAIAQAIWAVYERLKSTPRKVPHSSKHGVVVTVEGPNQMHAHFVISEETQKEVFIQQFSDSASAIQRAEGEESTTLEANTEKSGMWIRIK